MHSREVSTESILAIRRRSNRTNQNPIQSSSSIHLNPEFQKSLNRINPKNYSIRQFLSSSNRINPKKFPNRFNPWIPRISNRINPNKFSTLLKLHIPTKTKPNQSKPHPKKLFNSSQSGIFEKFKPNQSEKITKSVNF